MLYFDWCVCSIEIVVVFIDIFFFDVDDFWEVFFLGWILWLFFVMVVDSFLIIGFLMFNSFLGVCVSIENLFNFCWYFFLDFYGCRFLKLWSFKVYLLSILSFVKWVFILVLRLSYFFFRFLVFVRYEGFCGCLKELNFILICLVMGWFFGRLDCVWFRVSWNIFFVFLLFLGCCLLRVLVSSFVVSIIFICDSW